MFEWSEEQLAIRDAVRRFVEEEVKPQVEELEHGETPPYAVIRKLYQTFGLDVMARESAKKAIERKANGASGAPAARGEGGGGSAAMTLIPIVELCHYCPGIVTALGVSTGLAGGTIMRSGTPAQLERWGVDLMTMDKVGAWAITEPDSGSDALGGMKSTAVRDGDESKPLRKMGLHSSPTGELFLTDVRVGRDRLLGETEGTPGGSEGRESAKGNFVIERAGVAAMSLGLIEECLKLSVQYAKDRLLWERPIAEFQLIQLKLAQMEVARLNVENLVFRHIEMSAAGKSLTLAEASAMKLYSAQAATEVAMEAVQLFGGNGYMSEFRVEQLARDAKVFQIYAGTDEIQVTHIARDLLGR